MKKKKKEIVVIDSLITNDFHRIYIHKRNWKLLMPVPYSWKIDIKKINEMKK